MRAVCERMRLNWRRMDTKVSNMVFQSICAEAFAKLLVASNDNMYKNMRAILVRK
jgi:hypothetical protein